MNTTSLLNLRKFLAPEIVYGQGAIDLCGRHAQNFGASKVCIVTDPGVRAAGWAKSVEDSLDDTGIPYIIFDAITANPKAHEVMAGSNLCLKEGCDLIIAVGGGSPMDCAKGMGVIMGNGGQILDYEGVDMVPSPGPPMIFIPTTAGSSADVSQFAIITDTNRKVKIAIISKMVIPDIALIDPATTVSMPPALTAETGMDALCHACEAFVSTAASPLTDMAGISAVKIVFDYLAKACREPDNIEYRDKMMTASLMAGLAFSNASLGLVHAMAHSLGGSFGLPHGECNALLLEWVVQFNYPAAAAKHDQLAQAMGLNLDEYPDQERGHVIGNQISLLRKQVGIPRGLKGMGVTESSLPRLANFAFQDPCLATNPRQADPKQIERLYHKAY